MALCAACSSLTTPSCLTLSKSRNIMQWLVVVFHSRSDSRLVSVYYVDMLQIANKVKDLVLNLYKIIYQRSDFTWFLFDNSGVLFAK